jgi:hypothetical protein
MRRRDGGNRNPTHSYPLSSQPTADARASPYSHGEVEVLIGEPIHERNLH